ncbi:MAG: hypothetical protein K8E66_05675 [Phycisphaerales bacterium]|nr:hypothetical protein [Phycisphaerales bacterium]
MKKLTALTTLALMAGPVAAQVESQWNFDGDLSAAFGAGILDYWTPDAESKTTFGLASALAAPTPDGGDPMVAAIDFTNDLEAFVCLHGAGPNGGGAYTNDYTLIWDIYVPQSSWDSFDWLSVYNTNDSNTNDGDHFIWMGAEPGEFGVGAIGYAGALSPGTWHRYAITFESDDLGGVKVRQFIDGTLVGVGETTVDGRFALYCTDQPDNPWFHVLADESGDMAPCVIASFYFADYAWDSADIKALGCVSAGGATTPGPDCSTQDSFCDTPADFDGNGVVDTRDVLAFLNSWVLGCP